jgi:hypothetical protein
VQIRLMQKTTVMDDQITTFALERVAVADLGGDSFSVQAVIDVNTPAAVIVPSSAITFGSDNFQSTAHGFTTGLKVRIATDDTLPGPLLVATDYFVIVIDADNFKLASTLVLALAGTPINLTNDGVGTKPLLRLRSPAERSNFNNQISKIQAPVPRVLIGAISDRPQTSRSMRVLT